MSLSIYSETGAGILFREMTWLTSGGAKLISPSLRSMRLPHPESAVAGNPRIEWMTREVTVGSCIRDTKDDRIDLVKSFQPQFLNDDNMIDLKEERFFSM